MSFSPNSDFLLEITRGNVAGLKIMRALGEREGATADVNGEDIWRGNDLTPAPTSHLVIPTPADAGEQMAVVSEHANDTSSGVGAQTIEVHYLDAAGDEQSTVVTMDGTTGVDLTPSDVRFVQDIHTKTVGSNGVAVGHIKIYKKSDAGLVYSMIAAGGNMSMVPHKMVPRAKTLHLKMWVPSESQSKRVAVRLRSDCNNDAPPIRQAGVFLFKSTCYINGSTPGAIPLAYTIPAFSIVKASGFPDAIGSDVSVHWWGILVDDDE